MKAEKKLGLLLLGLGAVLLAMALVLVLLGIRKDAQRQTQAQQAVAVLQAAMEETAAAPAEEEPTTPTDPADPITLSSEFVDGHEYVGYLEFPSLERRLPVMKIQYVEDLQIAPCLEQGNPHTNDAVISAHNYPSHFGPIRDWTGGEQVVFTDLEGREIVYAVTTVQTISPRDVAQVMDSEHDLVLYTCTTGGAKRVMLGCDRI